MRRQDAVVSTNCAYEYSACGMNEACGMENSTRSIAPIESSAKGAKEASSVERESQAGMAFRCNREKGRYPMVCSTCEGNLIASEIRDRDGIPFVLWECRRVHRILPEAKHDHAGLWTSLRSASFVLVPALIAVVTMLLSL